MDRIFIAAGVLSFFLMYIYDLSTVRAGKKWGRVFFPAGAAGLVVSTAGLAVRCADSRTAGIFFAVTSVSAALFFVLLIYTLFFALPAEAYSGDSKSRMCVCRTGMYAVCRHPGMLWLAGFYLCSSLALDSAVFWLASVIFVLMDFIYILMQDIFIFPLQFADYADYRKNTPFLIPRAPGARKTASDRIDGERNRNEI